MGRGIRKLLRFDVLVHNRGDADMVLGNPYDHPELFTFSPCHGHYHFTDASIYELLDGAGNVTGTGTYKAGDNVEVNGVRLQITGAPSAGDSFNVTPASSRDIFDTMDKLINLFVGLVNYIRSLVGLVIPIFAEAATDAVG